MIKEFIKCLLVFFLFIFVTEQAIAGCLTRGNMKQTCEMLKQECPKGTIYALVNNYPGTDYKPACIPCNSEEYIPLDCVSIEEARKLCPNRYISYGCEVGSVKDCPDYQDKNRWEKTCTDPPGIFY